MTDIVIIGAGPAGMTAAVYALRAGKSVLLLEKDGFGGQMTQSPKIENFPGFSGISGAELADRMVDQVMACGAGLEIEEVTGIELRGSEKIVRTDCGEHHCKAVIIAAGAKHRRLGVTGEERFIGNGISFCAVCDGAIYEGGTTAVIGGGNSALQEAMLLSDICRKVIVVQNLDRLTGEEKLAEQLRARENVEFIFGSQVKEFRGGDDLETVVLRNISDGSETEISPDGVFVCIGLEPDNGFARGAAELDEHGYIISGESCVTGTEGIFAAGDCRTKSIRQITTAAADGTCAALAACRYIDGR